MIKFVDVEQKCYYVLHTHSKKCHTIGKIRDRTKLSLSSRQVWQISCIKNRIKDAIKFTREVSPFAARILAASLARIFALLASDFALASEIGDSAIIFGTKSVDFSGRVPFQVAALKAGKGQIM